MNAPQDPRSLLLARLGSLVGCARAEGYACITARHEHGAHAVDIDHPCIAIVLRGRKQVRTHAQALEFAPGDLFLIARRCRMDVTNIPDPDSGLYLTVTIPLCEEVLAAARLLWTDPISGRGDDLARLDSAEFATDLQHWLAALQAGRYTEARLALAALTVALCRRGHTTMLVPPPPSLAMRIRDLIRADPARDWQSTHVEAALGVSGATLRRRLVAEGTGLREVVAAARLACAMDLLYTTHWPVKTVAARVGYRSVASFTRRFSERYGLDPAHIGNAYVAEEHEAFTTGYDRRDSRLRVIYDNGTESEILQRSLQRALHRDDVARLVSEPAAGPLFGDILEPDDIVSGTIYVLRSKSTVPYIAEHRELIHKIGVTGGKVETRIANAAKDATYLLADVEVVATYQLSNINRTRLENLFHRIFSPAQLDLAIEDRFGNPIKPREWFLVPLQVIDEAVERVRDGSITGYVYDLHSARLVKAKSR